MLDVEERAKGAAQAWMEVRDAMALLIPTDDDGALTVRAINKAFTSLFELSEDEVLGHPLDAFLSTADADRLRERVGGDREPRSASELVAVRNGSGGSVLVEWELAPARDAAGLMWALVCVFRDPTAAGLPLGLRDAEAPVEVPNRAQLTSRLERSVQRIVQARGYAFALVGLELGGLEAIRRAYGAAAGEAAVEALVMRLRQRLRSNDLVARTDDGRLAILLDPFDPFGPIAPVLERIRPTLEASAPIAGTQRELTPARAAGAVWSREHPAGSAADAMDEVFAEVSRVPGDGGNGHGATGSAGRDAATDRPLVRLTRAVRDGQLQLLYQPLLCLDTGDAIGMEALLRWAHPDRGLLASRDFIGDAERTGLMTHIGRWVLWRACHQIKAWEALASPRPAVPIHLNLSASEFWNRELLAGLLRQTEEVGVNRSRIRLEIPETALRRDVAAASRVLDDLQGAGFEIWLDRFGEGGLPLRDLPGLPVHQVKVSPLSTWNRDARRNGGLPPLLRHTLAMGSELGWRIAATGIETRGQRERLQAAGCVFGQGFELSQPLDAARVGALARGSG